jgi:hypothetical protein
MTRSLHRAASPSNNIVLLKENATPPNASPPAMTIALVAPKNVRHVP